MIDVCVKMEGVEVIYCEIDDIPSPTDTLLVMYDPRLTGDKDVPFLRHEPRRMIVPIHRILYIEVLEDDDDEQYLTHVRKDSK